MSKQTPAAAAIVDLPIEFKREYKDMTPFRKVQSIKKQQ
jgi:hypothetical protein